MNNEFQWRNEMRKLGKPVEPTHDLWPDIALRIAQSPRRDHWRRITAIAASLVIASSAGLVAYRLDRGAVVPSSPASSVATPSTQIPASTLESSANDSAPRTALAWAVPADPRLASAAQDLDTASAELQKALETRPDAVFLVSMINRTNAQRMRLLRQSAISG